MSDTLQDIHGVAGVGEGELGELLSAFNAATGRLQAAHETLRAEVARLKGELCEANEQLERSRRLAALGEMAAGIAHEVRNPLGSIGLYAGMLEKDLAGLERERETARKIGRAVRGLDAVVNDVLAFSREMKVKVARVGAEELMGGALEEVMAGEGRGVRVERRNLAGVEVECDRELMHRALVNIVRNAVQAMETRKEKVLTVDAEEVAEGANSEDTARKGGATALRVMDNGPGISAEVMPRMFNPFFTTRATGTGLGLAIVHRIVDAHGGRVSVRNREGGGAEVEIVVRGGSRK